MRTKQEVISFLESKVGTTVPCPGRPDLDGQCVTLIKALMEFLGVPDPYKARGHAKTVISAYLAEEIADSGTGFLSVFSNKNMGVYNGVAYGHIWCNAGDGDGTYYEQNGQVPLKVTKGKTYSYDNVCNFDKYIKEETMPVDPLAECLAQHEQLVTEAVAKDKEIAELKKKLDEAKQDIERLNNELEECQNNPIENTEIPSEKARADGYFKEWESNGIKYHINYTIDQ